MSDTRFEKITVNLSAAVGIIATVAVIVVGGWVRANDSDLKEAKKVNVENAKQIAQNTSLIKANAVAINRNQGTLEQAAADAASNKGVLIRIETILEERAANSPN